MANIWHHRPRMHGSESQEVGATLSFLHIISNLKNFCFLFLRPWDWWGEDPTAAWASHDAEPAIREEQDCIFRYSWCTYCQGKLSCSFSSRNSLAQKNSILEYCGNKNKKKKKKNIKSSDTREIKVWVTSTRGEFHPTELLARVEERRVESSKYRVPKFNEKWTTKLGTIGAIFVTYSVAPFSSSIL